MRLWRGENIRQQQKRRDWEYEDAERSDGSNDVNQEAQTGNTCPDYRKRGEEMQVDAAAMHADEDCAMRKHGHGRDAEAEDAWQRTAMQEGQGEHARRDEIKEGGKQRYGSGRHATSLA